jgi:hypothetical protein
VKKIIGLVLLAGFMTIGLGCTEEKKDTKKPADATKPAGDAKPGDAKPGDKK